MKPTSLYDSLLLFFLLFLLPSMGCKKFVETDPPDTQANGSNVYANDPTAIAVMTGLYSSISRGNPGPNFASGTESFSLLCGLSADEYVLFEGADDRMSSFYRNALFSNNTAGYGTDYWTLLYDLIYHCNSALEGLINSTSLTESVKKQLMGEAKFMRAFFYFYLVNLYGDVALVTSTDYKKNSTLSRTVASTVYEEIINDLRDAKELLSAEYLDGQLNSFTASAERVRPNKYAATALLARVYLYINDWSKAETEATAVIDNKSMYDTVSLNNAFLMAAMGNKEAIWQLQGVYSDRNTEDARMFIITTELSNTTPVRISDTLLNSFELGDNRKTVGNWMDTITLSGNTYYYPYKYKNTTSSVTEYLVVMRLAEQYLIRAEARAHQSKFSEAQADLNVIRNRAGLPNTSASDKEALLVSILRERQLELFSEWGHRWFDLKRTNNVDAVMSVVTPLKANGSQWNSFQRLYPIPFSETQRGPNLTQTIGY